MDATERLAARYLESLGLGTVVFEPDGNVPPDFSVGGKVAVEVRRLNQNYEKPAAEAEGLEERAIPLWQAFKSLLPTLGPSVAGECWYVGINFRRPLAPWKQLKPLAVSVLTSFMRSPSRTNQTLNVAPNLEIDVFRAGKDHGAFFVLGTSVDDDSGGWVMHELVKNLRLVLAEKERKVAPYRPRYPSWWLVVADYIDYGMEDVDRQVFRSEIVPALRHSFERLVLLDPRGERSPFEA